MINFKNINKLILNTKMIIIKYNAHLNFSLSHNLNLKGKIQFVFNLIKFIKFLI
jgi:hypothetical protein